MFKGYKILGVCVTQIGDEGTTSYIENLNECAVKNGYRLLVYQSSSDLYWNSNAENGDKAVFDFIHYDILDGLVILSDRFYDKSIVRNIASKAAEYGIPVFWKGDYNDGCINISYDVKGCFERLVRHVVCDHGIKDSCFVAGMKGEKNSEERISVYRKVIEEDGQVFSEDRLFYGDYWSGPAEKAVDQMLASGHLPKAIICANDVMALAIYNYLLDRDYKVPEDVIITGFDGIVAASCSGCEIATCSENFKGFSEAVMSALNEYHENGELSGDIVVDMILHPRRSCGCQTDERLNNATKVILDYQNGMFKYQGDERLIYEMSEDVFTCNNIREFSEYFGKCHLDRTTILFNGDAFMESVHPSEYDRNETFDENMIMLFNTEISSEFLPQVFNVKDVVPGYDWILKSEKPIVFSSLSFLGKARGLLVTYTDITRFYFRKIQQCVTLFNNAIGNYLLYTHVRHVNKSMTYMSEHDYLTGLYNRNGFFEHLSDVKEKVTLNKKICVVSIDLNDLKKINDTYGHEEGDFAIKTLANALKILPYSDKVCGRFGGDEMVVCFVTNVSEARAEEMIELEAKSAIKNYLNNINGISGKPYRVWASIGVSVNDISNFTFTKALEDSDVKMYKEKSELKRRKTDRRE